MAHGSQCGCGMCKIGKKLGMIKTNPEAKTECKCDSGKDSAECCATEE